MLAIIRALILALFSFEVAFCFRLQSRHTYSLKDSHEVPVAWSRVGSAHPGILITLQIGLKQSRFDELEKQLHEGWSTCFLALVSAGAEPASKRFSKSFSCCFLDGFLEDGYNLVTIGCFANRPSLE